jgi:hypothetical protein
MMVQLKLYNFSCLTSNSWFLIPGTVIETLMKNLTLRNSTDNLKMKRLKKLIYRIHKLILIMATQIFHREILKANRHTLQIIATNSDLNLIN